MENTSLILIFTAGIYNILLGVFHIMFWKLRLFKWGDELKKMSFVNRGVMQIMNLCLIALFFIMAYISFFHTHELYNTSLGRALLIAFSLFWLLRLIEQFIFFGKKGILFPVIFSVGLLLYLIPVIISISMLPH